MATFLIIDDEETFAKNAARFLEKSGHTVLTAGTGAEGVKAMTASSPDAIVLDYRLPDTDGITLISQLRALDDSVPILMITGHGSIELAVEAMKAGTNDLLAKPVSLTNLRERLTRMAQRQRETSRLEYYEAKVRDTGQIDAILGNSEAISKVRQRIARINEFDATDNLPPVLIIGETGTGKELVARACHFGSSRREQPFIEVNCAAIPSMLLESELFGHEKGAFTDARERKIGLIEAADGGTLFLDEIGEMDVGLQAKLLKVIEDGRLRRVGSVQERRVSVRILAATNQNLEERIKLGAFRADLYFRLRVLQVLIPPLRERTGDALMLAKVFLAEFGRRYRKENLHFSPEAQTAISSHTWPGNVRELRNLTEQAVMLAAESSISTGDLLLPSTPPPVSRATSFASMLTPDDDDDGGSALDRVEKDLLSKALQSANGNVSQAARTLGISRDTLRYRMEKHGFPTGRPAR